VKLLSWVKSAIEFIKIPAGPQKAGPQPAEPQPDAPARASHATDELPVHAGPDRPADRIDIPVGAAHETPLRVETETRIRVEPEGPPGPEEIDRRRGIVRTFFNDYWSSIDDKPSSFAERLDKAEDYINERVAAGGEAWRLGAATRKQLGLPPSKKR
jgi:hypothetical protein